MLAAAPTSEAVRFRRALTAIVVAGLALRLAYALVVMHGVGVAGDGLEFHSLTRQLAAGDGYIEPLFLAPTHVPTADKPPLYPLVLALPAVLGAGSIVWNRVVSCLMGALLVAALGLLGRRAAGDRAGLAAAAIGAAYPVFVGLDGSVRSESLYAPLIAFVLLCAYRLRDRPETSRALTLGAVVGLAALTRSEAIALVVLAPIAAPRARLRTLTLCVLACALVLSPWVIRNWTTFGEPTLSTNSGSLIYGANCHDAYYSGLIGAWGCYPPLRATRALNEVKVASRLRSAGFRYARRHAARVPAVAAVRLLRVWDLWKPWPTSRFEALIDDRDLGVARAGLVVYYVLIALAAAGALLLRRARRPLAILLTPVVLVSLLALLTYGTSRFRVPADVSIVVLAGISLAASSRRIRPAS
jgi:hypothetical protein